MKYTNDIRHTIHTKNMEISMRLNDECRNGHEDFSITATIWESGKPHVDRYMIAGGCCHDEKLKHSPGLAIFVRLHLCDSDGIPMYASENGFYSLRHGFSKTKPEDEAFSAEFCEYYRITPEQFAQLNTCRNELQYALALQNLGILKQWKKEAEDAIQLLFEMTGKRFKSTATRSQYTPPTPEAIAEEEEKERSGYYTPEATAQRAEEKKMGRLKELVAEKYTEIGKAESKYDALEQVLRIGGEKALNNCIYYDHTHSIAFNWTDTEPHLTPQELQDLTAALILRNGLRIEDRKK